MLVAQVFSVYQDLKNSFASASFQTSTQMYLKTYNKSNFDIESYGRYIFQNPALYCILQNSRVSSQGFKYYKIKYPTVVHCWNVWFSSMRTSKHLWTYSSIILNLLPPGPNISFCFATHWIVSLALCKMMTSIQTFYLLHCKTSTVCTSKRKHT